jgi:hypothetical protein
MLLAQDLQLALDVFQTQELFLEPLDMSFGCS